MKNTMAVLVACIFPIFGIVQAQEVVSKQLSIGIYGMNLRCTWRANTSHNLVYVTENMVGGKLVSCLVNTNDGKQYLVTTNEALEDNIRIKTPISIPFDMTPGVYGLRIQIILPEDLSPTMDFMHHEITVLSPITFPTGKAVLRPGQRVFVRWMGKKLPGGCSVHLHINSETNSLTWNLGTNLLSKSRMRIQIPTNAPSDVGYQLEIRTDTTPMESLGAVGPTLSIQPRVRRF